MRAQIPLGGCTDTVRESALKVEWEKNPLPHQGLEPVAVLCLASLLDSLPAELSLPLCIPLSVIFRPAEAVPEMGIPNIAECLSWVPTELSLPLCIPLSVIFRPAEAAPEMGIPNMVETAPETGIPSTAKCFVLRWPCVAGRTKKYKDKLSTLASTLNGTHC